MKIKAQLNKKVDQNDPFLMGGHGVVSARTYKREVPAWAVNNARVRKLLSQSFPKLETDPNQRAAAARWAAVIHLYFRMRYTRSQIAEELGSSVSKVHGMIRSILRVSKGLRANDKGPRGKAKGRPKKSSPQHLF